MPNNRIHYAVYQAGLKTEGVDAAGDAYTAIRGLQSIDMTTNFNLRDIFQIGQLASYENVEDVPDIQVNTTKLLDGNPLIYHLATKNASTPDLAGRSNDRSILAMAIFTDTLESATGTPIAQVATSGMYVSRVAYNFPLDQDFSEEVSFVGNNKLWQNDPNVVIAYPAWSTTIFTGAFNNLDTPPGSGGLQQRQDLLFATAVATTDSNGAITDRDCTILPTVIPGVASDGTHDLNDANRPRLSNISVSVDLGRENINELGRRGPYHRFVSFPVSVTCEIGITATSGDAISAAEDGVLQAASTCTTASNLSKNTIRIATCEGTRIYLGLNNKLSSVNQTGGDTGGGNMTVSYTFMNSNDFTVMHTSDPNSNFSVAADGDTYLTN